MNEIIIAEHISHGFNGHVVLNDITFRVQRGEVFGLLGPSGAGKTTLIKILTGQLRQEKGNAWILGKDTRRAGGEEQKQIGMMMDHCGLYERLSVYDNLAFYSDIYQVSRSVIDDVLKSVGLQESRHIAVSRLSKGMKTRLSLARALLKSGNILFLDEPSAGLDPVTTKEIHRVLEKQKEKGTTIFLTTHNMFEAETLCGHIALLSCGRILEYGSPADICKKYDHLKKLRISFKDGKKAVLENGSGSALLMKAYLEKNMIEKIHSTEPTLETVFVELTGKGLS